jgi:branched-chain amino acid transport system substrate-binding protein
MKKPLTRRDFLAVSGSALAGASVLGLVGCGGDGQAGQGGGSGPVKFAVVLPLSGPGAFDGKQVLAAAEYAANEINENGGVLGGRKIEIRSYDDEGTPEAGVAAVRKAITNDNVDVVTGGFNSPVSLAEKPIIAQYNKLNIVTISKAPEITEEGDNPLLFRLNSRSDQDVEAYTNFMVNELEPQSMYFLATNDEYGQAEVEVYSQKLEEAGVEIAGRDFVDRTARDFTSQVLRIKRVNPDAVYVPISNTSQGAQFYKQAEQQGLDTTFLSGAGTLNYTLIRLAGNEAVEGLYGADVYARGIDTPENNAFVKGYEKATDYKAEKIAVLGYESVRLPALAMDEAGTTDPNEVAEVLRNKKWTTPRGTIRFDETGQALSEVKPLVVENGEIQVVSGNE